MVLQNICIFIRFQEIRPRISSGEPGKILWQSIVQSFPNVSEYRPSSLNGSDFSFVSFVVSQYLLIPLRARKMPCIILVLNRITCQSCVSFCLQSG